MSLAVFLNVIMDMQKIIIIIIFHLEVNPVVKQSGRLNFSEYPRIIGGCLFSMVFYALV